MNDLVQITRYKNYTKCPAFCKYSYSMPVASFEMNAVQKMIFSIYKKTFKNLTGASEVDWSYVKQASQVALLNLEDSSPEQLKIQAANLLENIRVWYTNHYRDLYVDGLFEIKASVDNDIHALSFVIHGVMQSEKEENALTLLDFTEEMDSNDFIRDITWRAKVWALKKQKVNIKHILSIAKSNKNSFKINRFTINNQDDFYNKTDQTLKMIGMGIKNKIFYPSVTEMCNTCNYNSICGW